MWPTFLHPPKDFLSSSVWPRRDYVCTFDWKESLLICFENCQGVPYSHRQSRNRVMNNFIIVTITPHVRDSLEGKSMIVHSKKSFLLTSVCPGTGYAWEELLIDLCCESYQGVPYSHTGRVDSGWWTICYWLTLIVKCCILIFILCKEKK